MTVFQGLQKKGRKLVSSARHKLFPGSIRQRIEELNARIQIADDAGGFMDGGFWKEQLYPWINARLGELSTKLHHGRRTHPDDPMGYYEVGGFENLTDFVKHITNLQTQKAKALEELDKIEGEMEEKNGR